MSKAKKKIKTIRAYVEQKDGSFITNPKIKHLKPTVIEPTIIKPIVIKPTSFEYLKDDTLLEIIRSSKKQNDLARLAIAVLAKRPGYGR